MNNVVDEVLNTAQTDNKIKYKIIHADSTEEIVQLELYTPVTTEGTALNKVLFDSIADDINSRLLTSNKATDSEAQAGTNTTKYIVPSTLQAKLNKMSNYKSGSASGGQNGATTTIFQPSDIGSATTGTVTIDGYISAQGTGQYPNNIKINGSSMHGAEQRFNNEGNIVRSGIGSSTQEIIAQYSGSTSSTPFKIIINLNAKTIYVITAITTHNVSQPYGLCTALIHYSSLTNIQLFLRSGSSSKTSTANYYITYTR